MGGERTIHHVAGEWLVARAASSLGVGNGVVGSVADGMVCKGTGGRVPGSETHFRALLGDANDT